MSSHAPGSGTIAALAAPSPASPAPSPGPSDPSRTRAPAPPDGDPEVVRAFAQAAARRICRVAAASLERIRQP